jgi:small subunit ribosomal protein S16
MLMIRLSRIGKKNKPMYRLIISEKSRDLYGRSLEILGSYNPYSKELEAQADRIKYWLSRGAGMSATVNNLLIEKKIIEGKKIKAIRVKKGEKEEKAAAPASVSSSGEAKSAPVSAVSPAPAIEEKPVDREPVSASNPEKEKKEENKAA